MLGARREQGARQLGDADRARCRWARPSSDAACVRPAAGGRFTPGTIIRATADSMPKPSDRRAFRHALDRLARAAAAMTSSRSTPCRSARAHHRAGRAAAASFPTPIRPWRDDGRHRLARRGRVGAQRAQHGAVRRAGRRTRGTRCTSRRSSPASSTSRSRSSASACGRRACVSELTGRRVRRTPRVRGAPARRPRGRPHRRRAPGHQLRLRDVEPRGAHGGVDGRLHGGGVVLLRPRTDAAALGRRSPPRARCSRSSPRPRRSFSSPRSASKHCCSGPLASRRAAGRPPGGRRDAGWPGRLRGSSRSRSSCIPNWTDYRFYNWQISVTRKPSYDLRSLLNRVTWFPIVHDIFTRMWFMVVVGVAGLFGVLARWRTVPPGRATAGDLDRTRDPRAAPSRRRQRTTVHLLHSGARGVDGDRPRTGPPTRSPSNSHVSRAERRSSPCLSCFYALYVMVGPLSRLVALYEPRSRRPTRRAPSPRSRTVAVYAAWPTLMSFLGGRQWSSSRRIRRRRRSCVCGSARAVRPVGADAAATRTIWRRWSSASILPPGTLVHGKLANGLSLENRIRPIFVGRGFGNYDDRKQRDDVRYILTYVAPYVGYEGPVIRDVLEAYPDRTIIRTFDVAETATGHDRAALIDKFGRTGSRGPALPRAGTDRAHD